MTIGGLGSILTQDFGLIVFTSLAFVLIVYLAYSMAHPEKF
jgi:hypothetical protein